jgi:peptide/nickel transport system ATP-binding protein
MARCATMARIFRNWPSGPQRQQIASLQMVFQNPFDTLNPSHSIGGQISRVIRKFGVETDKKKIFERVMRLLDTVKLPRDFYFRKPRQLSGGQKQRIGIARAFAGNPSMVIADEPVSALDVSVAAAVTELLMDIQRKKNHPIVHQPRSECRTLPVRSHCRHVPGHILERGTTTEIFRTALPPLYGGTPVCRADCRPGGHQTGDRVGRQSAQCHETAERMPILHPLPPAHR